MHAQSFSPVWHFVAPCTTPYPARLLCPWDFPSKNTGVGCHFLLQGIFLTQGLNWHLPVLFRWQADSVVTLSHRGSPVSLYVQEKIQTSFFFLFICLSFKNKNHICLRRTWWFDVPIHSEMITTVKLINISISSHTFFFLWKHLNSILLADFESIIQCY